MSTGTTRPEEPAGLWVFFSAIGMSFLLVGIAAFAASRHYQSTLENQRLARAELRRAACSERGALFVPRVKSRLPLADPHSRLWADAPAVELKLQRQTITMPMLEIASIEHVRLQGLVDREHIAWRLSWLDETQDSNVDTGRFSDAVALQFPITRNAAFSMGAAGQRVQILHWKALWQKDVDEHFQDVQDLHPNYWVDLYWFAEGRPYEVPASFSDPRSHAWFTAYSAGNPISDIHRTLPVEELIAEGYGTLTSQISSVSVGKGVWKDGEWAVVFSRPMQTDDVLDYQFWLGSRSQVSVAVWDGAGGNVGGRKHWSDWAEYEVSP